MSAHILTNGLLTTQEAAHRLGLAIGTLQNWRIRGEGPAWVRLGRAVRYRETDLERFIDQHQVHPAL